MPGTISDTQAHSLLDSIFGSGSPATWYLGALKASAVEVSASGYARVAVTNNSTNFPAAAARTKLLHVAQAFAAASAGVDWGTVESIGFFTASSGGSPLVTVSLAGAAQNFYALAADDILRCAGHGYIAGQRVRVAVSANVSLPTGLAAATDYYVVNPATDTLQLSATSGGAAIDLSADGVGSIFAWRSKGVSDGDILNLSIDDLSISIAA